MVGGDRSIDRSINQICVTQFLSGAAGLGGLHALFALYPYTLEMKDEKLKNPRRV